MGNSFDRSRYGLRTLLGTCLALFWLAGAAVAQSACRDDTLMLRGDWGSVRFTVEVADDPEELAQGLMGRESMPISSGMLFVYPTPRPSNFWMRNTLIPLDMLFVNPQGVVTHIHSNAIPLDETSIYGGENVLAVLEINGGLAKRLGITEGTQVRHSAFAETAPVWPC